MRVPGIKPCCLLCIIVRSSLAALMECNETIYRELQPCGNIELYRNYTNDESHILNYKQHGRYCYADSRSIKLPSQKWLEADAECKKAGGRLAVFTTQMDWDDFFTDSTAVYDDVAFYFLGAKKFVGRWYWQINGSTELVTLDEWSTQLPRRNCMVVFQRGMRSAHCYRKFSYICQTKRYEAYEGKANLQIITPYNLGTDHLTHGHEVEIECWAKTEKQMVIILVNPESEHIVLYDDSRRRMRIDNLEFYDIQTEHSYHYEFQRCFQYAHLKMKFRVLHTKEEVFLFRLICSRPLDVSSRDRLESLQVSSRFIFTTTGYYDYGDEPALKDKRDDGQDEKGISLFRLSYLLPMSFGLGVFTVCIIWRMRRTQASAAIEFQAIYEGDVLQTEIEELPDNKETNETKSESAAPDPDDVIHKKTTVSSVVTAHTGVTGTGRSAATRTDTHT